MKSAFASRSRELRAVIFDLDDTLVDSTVNYAKFKTLVIDKIASYGEPRSHYSATETIVAIVSRYEEQMRREGVSGSVMQERMVEFDRIMDEVELEKVSETKAIRGATDLLRLLKENGMKIGILTRGCEDYATAALSNAGMLELVDAIECRNSKTKPKPNPEAYLKLVKKLGVRKEETLFVGDHPIDAQCAANAGVPFVAVRTGDVPEKELREAGSVEVFRDVADMVEWLKDMLRLS